MKRVDLKKCGMLFLFFVKIGCFTFGGGWSILAQIEQEFIDRRQLITKSDLLDLTATGRSLPGIMITNITMLFGVQVAGWLGGICAVVGVAVPSIVILTVVTFFYGALKDNFWCACLLRGIRCAVVPIIASAAISLGKEAFKVKSGIVICAIAFALSFVPGVSNILLVVLGVIAAFIWMGAEKKHGLS